MHRVVEFAEKLSIAFITFYISSPKNSVGRRTHAPVMKHLHHRCIPLYQELPSDLFLMQMVFESVHMIAHAGPYLPDHSRYADKPVAPWLSLSLSSHSNKH